MNSGKSTLELRRTEKQSVKTGKSSCQNSRIRLDSHLLQQVFETAADGMCIIDADFNIVQLNQTLSDMLAIPKESVIGKKCHEVLSSSECQTSACPLSRILKGAERIEQEIIKERGEGTKLACILTATPVRGPGGEIIGMVEDFKDITERKRMEDSLRDTNHELEITSESLKEKNIILSGVLNQIETDRRQMLSHIDSNIAKLLIPALTKLEAGLEPTGKTYIEQLRHNLAEITSSFMGELATRYARLSPRELEICNFIKNGLCSKEIASLLSVSFRTVLKQRQNIRKKLGINKEKVSLATFLQVLD